MTRPIASDQQRLRKLLRLHLRALEKSIKDPQARPIDALRNTRTLVLLARAKLLIDGFEEIPPDDADDDDLDTMRNKLNDRLNRLLTDDETDDDDPNR